MANKILFLIPTILLTLQTFAISESEMPKYCDNYPYGKDKKSLSELEKQNGNTKMFGECYDGTELNITFDQLNKTVSEINNSSMESLAIKFQDELTKEAIMGVIAIRNNTQVIFPEFTSDKTEKCLKEKDEDLYKKVAELTGPGVKPFEDFQKGILSLKMINALTADALINIRNPIVKRHEKEMYQADNDARYKCKDKFNPGLVATPKDSIEYRKCVETELAPLNKKHEEEISPYNSQLQEIAKNGYELFDFGGSWTRLFQFKGDKFAPSKFTDAVKKNMKNSDKLIKKLEEAFRTNQNPDNLFAHYKEEITNALNGQFSSMSMMGALKNKSKDLITELDDGAKQYCQVLGKPEGEYSHLNPSLVANFFNNQKTKNLSKEEYEKSLIKNQAIHCYLLATHGEPPVHWKSKLALGAGVVAATVMLGPVGGIAVGTSLGAGLSIAGTGLAIWGGTESYKGFQDAQREQDLMMAGMSDWKRVTEAMSKSNTNMAWSTADVVLAPLDLKSLLILKDLGLTKNVTKRLADVVADEIKATGNDIMNLSEEAKEVAEKLILARKTNPAPMSDELKLLLANAETDPETKSLMLAIIDKLQRKHTNNPESLWDDLSKRLKECPLAKR